MSPGRVGAGTPGGEERTPDAGPWLLAGWLAAAKLKKLRQRRTS